MLDLEEVRLARALGVIIDEELKKGTQLPKEIIDAYKELHLHWQYQMSREMS